MTRRSASLLFIVGLLIWGVGCATTSAEATKSARPSGPKTAETEPRSPLQAAQRWGDVRVERLVRVDRQVYRAVVTQVSKTEQNRRDEPKTLSLEIRRSSESDAWRVTSADPTDDRAYWPGIGGDD